MKNIICWIFGHKSVFDSKFYPNIAAEIVTKVEFISVCQRCGKKEITTYECDTEDD